MASFEIGLLSWATYSKHHFTAKRLRYAFVHRAVVFDLNWLDKWRGFFFKLGISYEFSLSGMSDLVGFFSLSVLIGFEFIVPLSQPISFVPFAPVFPRVATERQTIERSVIIFFGFLSLQLSSSFKTWKERFQRNTRNMEVLEEHLQKKDAELLHRCLVRWMKFMLRCKAEKSYQRKLVAKVKPLSPEKSIHAKSVVAVVVYQLSSDFVFYFFCSLSKDGGLYCIQKRELKSCKRYGC